MQHSVKSTVTQTHANEVFLATHMYDKEDYTKSVFVTTFFVKKIELFTIAL